MSLSGTLDRDTGEYLDSSDKQPDHMTRESRLRRFRRRLSRRAAGSASLPEATSKPDGPVTPPQADSDNAESSHAHGRESREGGETYLEDYKKIVRSGSSTRKLTSADRPY